MLLLGLNIGLVASLVYSVFVSHSFPGILAISCGAVGGVTVYSRVRAWKSGAAGRLYDLVRNDETATKKLRNMDILFWATGGFNSAVCLWYALKGYVDH